MGDPGCLVGGISGLGPCLENPMDGGAWWAAVHGVAKSQTRLSDFTFTFHVHALEKEMATHSSVLAWRIPGTGEPGGQLSMGSYRVRHPRAPGWGRQHHSQRETPFVPSKRLPDWASLELSPSVESCGCGLGFKCN